MAQLSSLSTSHELSSAIQHLSGTDCRASCPVLVAGLRPPRLLQDGPHATPSCRRPRQVARMRIRGIRDDARELDGARRGQRVEEAHVVGQQQLLLVRERGKGKLEQGP